MTEKVSIIIRALNEAEMIGETLEAINTQQTSPDEIIVVDCYSTDGTPDIAKKKGASVIRMHPEEFTYGRGINYGIENAEGDYLIILSAHAVPTRQDWLGNLLAAVTDKDVAGAYGKQISTVDSDPIEARSLEYTFDDTARTQTDDSFFSNANSIIDRKVWEENKFNEDIPYSEDQKWAETVQKKGYKIRYVPDAPVIHVHHETTREIFNRNRNQGQAQQMLNSKSDFSLPGILIRIIQEVALDWMYIAKRRSNPKHFLRAPIYRTAETIGYYTGLRRDNLVDKSNAGN